MGNVIFTRPEACHAQEVKTLVDENEQLDSNSLYIYLIWCSFFSQNSAIAIKNNEVISFVTGFRKPDDPETYFLWQTAAKKRHGVANLGLNLILYAVEKEIENGIKAIEASVNKKNTPIVMLMKTLNKRVGGDLSTTSLFSSEQLSHEGMQHHEETLIRIEIN